MQRTCTTMLVAALLSLFAAATACSDSDGPSDARSRDAADGGPRDAAGDGDAGSDASPTPPWNRELPSASTLAKQRGLRVVRTIVHSHSISSHDACDGMPRLDGDKPNEPCLQDLRDAVCATRIDALMLTEHIDSLSKRPYAELLVQRGDDTLVAKGAENVAVRMRCKNGHEVLFVPGAELNHSMPLGLERHVAGATQDLPSIYSSTDPSLVPKLRAAGAVVMIAHTEQRKLAELKAHGLDGIEIYNLHANLDPDIRADYLGLPSFGYLDAIAPFISRKPSAPEPDLVFAAFFVEAKPSLDNWHGLLANGKMTGVAGTDAHQNVLNLRLRDGERMDSYRRMYRWFSNFVLVPSVDLDAIKSALRDGRSYVAFEAYGTPTGFDFFARAAGATVEMGGEATLADSPTLSATLPTLAKGSPRGADDPEVVLRLLRIDANGAAQVVREGKAGEAIVELAVTQAGAYRVEALITPNHLAPWLGEDPSRYVKKTVWIYSNPIYIK